MRLESSPRKCNAIMIGIGGNEWSFGRSSGRDAAANVTVVNAVAPAASVGLGIGDEILRRVLYGRHQASEQRTVARLEDTVAGIVVICAGYRDAERDFFYMRA